jgi:hypothetical protein
MSHYLLEQFFLASGISQAAGHPGSNSIVSGIIAGKLAAAAIHLIIAEIHQRKTKSNHSKESQKRPPRCLAH